MVGINLTQPGRDIVGKCLDNGIIINCTAGNVLRLVPPLNINKSHVDEVIKVLDEVLASYR
ncbi:Acetylornithine aminotransferase [bioreactor metagenome]|uniref:Acetylornithine aminotransferase n=1 Tax=bioreactor metagenome TaxID=1076179 RepID=A0A645DTC4_9ZZZZ